MHPYFQLQYLNALPLMILALAPTTTLAIAQDTSSDTTASFHDLDNSNLRHVCGRAAGSLYRDCYVACGVRATTSTKAHGGGAAVSVANGELSSVSSSPITTRASPSSSAAPMRNVHASANGLAIGLTIAFIMCFFVSAAAVGLHYMRSNGGLPVWN
ncbi:hypothetical protein EJ03DRAFT_348112 [Teratosphaeria nubilosa]|uniref:Uncharacterized protein n=1 Tax=Teratosphaeria nubilosa TaxID=161662 RepID=A0A6G1LJM1_9PEZI|nr:hypothetical protein EJ03DRAFT_348112 [Teratosphaeria nubilosa]